MHHANILPGRGPFRCTDPSNHAYRADLAIRRRRTARAIASTAPPLWRGSLPRDGRTGRGRLLVGRGGALPKECVALWGVERWRQSRHSRSAACGSLTLIVSPDLESWHSRRGFRAGRRQGGAERAAPPSGAARCPRARNLLLSCAYSASAYGLLSARSEPPAFRSMKKLTRWYFLH